MWPFFHLIFKMIFTDSLRKNSDFQAVYKSGISYANKYLVIYTSKNGTDRNRLGISVSKKVGNSVVRHRIKRLVKESYILHEQMFNSGLDIAVIARQGSDACDYASIESALLHLMKLNGTLDNSLKG